MTKRRQRAQTLPGIVCACATLRRAARLVTQLYDEELRPQLPVSQFALLSSIAERPGCPQSTLAKALAFDKTTLSRNLSLLERNGWIARAITNDRRERGFEATPAGAKLLAAAKPGWRRAQARLRSAMTAEQWNMMWHVMHDVTDSAIRAHEPKGR